MNIKKNKSKLGMVEALRTCVAVGFSLLLVCAVVADKNVIRFCVLGSRKNTALDLCDFRSIFLILAARDTVRILKGGKVVTEYTIAASKA